MLRLLTIATVLLLSVVAIWHLSSILVPAENRGPALPFNENDWHSSRNRMEMLPSVRALVTRGMSRAALTQLLGEPDRDWRNDVARAIVESSDPDSSGYMPTLNTDFVVGYYLSSRTNFVANEVWNRFLCVAFDSDDRVVDTFVSVG